jgi:hypothetical protein
MRISAHGFFVLNAQQIESGNQERRKRSDRINKIDKMRSNKSGTSDSVNSVHSLENPLPNSRKVYVAGRQHVDLHVPSFVMSSEVKTSLTISLIT